MIKVIHTKPHKLGKEPLSRLGKFIANVTLVTDAKLVLVECKGEEAKLTKTKKGKLKLFGGYEAYSTFLKPILISETEKIEVGDWMYWNGTTKQIIEATISFSPNDPSSPIVSKILALSEHFSPQQLQMIVDGKLKDGDKVLIECVEVSSINKVEEIQKKPNGDTFIPTHKQIKLNPHITIYPVEEKMVAESELLNINQYEKIKHTPSILLWFWVWYYTKNG